MARTVLAVAATDSRGSTATFTDADPVNGNAFLNNGSTGFVVNNLGTSSVIVTIRVPSTSTFDGLTVADRSEAVPPGGFYFFGNLPAVKYNQTVDASVYVDFTGPCKIAAFQIDTSL